MGVWFGIGYMLEKRWAAVPAQSFTADGTAEGKITISDASLFKVKQQVVLRSNTVLSRDDLEVKRVTDKNTLYVGPRAGNIDSRADLSAYLTANSAVILANEQLRSKIPEQEIERHTYEEEPVVARRSVLVDKLGNKIDNVVDSNGVNRIAVDGMFTAEVDVQVDVDIDGDYDPILNPDPDSIGLIGHTRSNPTNQTHQVQRQTAKRGTVDTDTVSADVSLHDNNGNAYTSLNPLPTSGSFEKFFTVIAASKWMELAVYDHVVPTFSMGNTVLTLDYYEDDALLGQAVITGVDSPTAWDMKLNRYIDEDDGTPLEDDDDSLLNLD